MFSLVITIISIALVAALALATIYYSGAAFTRGSGTQALEPRKVAPGGYPVTRHSTAYRYAHLA